MRLGAARPENRMTGAVASLVILLHRIGLRRLSVVHEKPAFRAAFSRRRCLLPADGFYEWDPVAARGGAKAFKQPYFISPEGSAAGMAMAGLYEFWRYPARRDDPDAWVATGAVITTEATDAAGRVHPRMRLTVAPEHWQDWLDPEHQDVADLRALLEQPAAGRLAVRPVSTAVNSVRNNGPGLLDPVELQQSAFADTAVRLAAHHTSSSASAPSLPGP